MGKTKSRSYTITPGKSSDRRTHQQVGAFLFVVGGISMSMRQEAPEAQKQFYNSKEWQRCRATYIASVGGLCERCEAKGIIRPGKIVHHKEYITAQNVTDPVVLLNPDNLEYLCLECHNSEHFKSNKRYVIDEFGKVEIR